MNAKAVLVASAAAVLLISGAVVARADEMGGKKVACMGINSCKGHGSCKSAQNDCKGKNGCKGQGKTMTTAEDCKAKGGKMMSDMK